jgi:hypothetical protein
VKRAPAMGSILCFSLSAVAAALILRSLIEIHANYFIPIYWDEWEFARELASPQNYAPSVLGLFAKHNEHIIATTKLLFWADYAFFRLTNGPLVLTIVIVDGINAWLLTTLLFMGRRRDRLFWTVLLIFLAASLSLVTWENLFWAFQPQVSLVLLFAIAAFRIAIAMLQDMSQDMFKDAGVASFGWLAALAMTMGLGVFSMGNGVAIPVAVILLLLLLRASWFQIGVTLCVGAVLIVVFIILTRNSPPIGDPSLKTPVNMAWFFLVMIGGPLSSNAAPAAILGLGLVASLGALAAVYALVVRQREAPIDPVFAGLYAFAAFLCASAAGAAWARTELGIASALSSRYMTPMLFLWMTSFAILIRLCWLCPGTWRYANAVVWLGIIAAFGAMSWSDLRPGGLDAGRSMSTRINQAAYFVASGANAPTELRQLYPDPKKIIQAIAFLRDHRLNLFSPYGGLSMPLADEIQEIERSAPAATCSLAALDQIVRFDAETWKVVGWASDDRRQTPRWILAVDAANNLLGFTAPMVPRPDVTRAIGARGHFRGFEVPLRLGPVSPGPFALIAITAEGPCRILLRGSAACAPLGAQATLCSR